MFTYSLRSISTIFAFFYCCIINASTLADISSFYENNRVISGLTEKLISYSEIFLGKPYNNYSNGDEEETLIAAPSMNLDSFDCVSLVETVVALAKADNAANFQEIYNDIKYNKGKKNFFHRNHFMSADWNINNSIKGYITDITPSLATNNIHNYSLSTIINKPGWYVKLQQPLTWQHYSGQTLTPSIKYQLSQYEHNAIKTTSSINYISAQQFLSATDIEKNVLLSKLPAISIVEFVRKNWQINDILGTDLAVSHVGFLIKTKKNLILRHASSQAGKVVDVNFKQYITSKIKQKSFAGFNIEKINLSS